MFIEPQLNTFFTQISFSKLWVLICFCFFLVPVLARLCIQQLGCTIYENTKIEILAQYIPSLGSLGLLGIRYEWVGCQSKYLCRDCQYLKMLKWGSFWIIFWDIRQASHAKGMKEAEIIQTWRIRLYSGKLLAFALCKQELYWITVGDEWSYLVTIEDSWCHPFVFVSLCVVVQGSFLGREWSSDDKSEADVDQGDNRRAARSPRFPRCWLIEWTKTPDTEGHID